MSYWNMFFIASWKKGGQALPNTSLEEMISSIEGQIEEDNKFIEE